MHPRPALSLPAPPPSWADRLLAWRDGLLASARFRRLAAALPFTRPVLRRRARDLFDLCAGFVYSQVLLAFVRLGLHDELHRAPRTAVDLAARLALPPDAAERLLRAACGLGLAEHRPGDRYGLGPLGAALVDNPGVTGMIEHHALLYADLRDPVALLRGEVSDTALAAYWPYAGARPPNALQREEVGRYTALMAASQPLVADEILAAYPVRRHRCLLDVGGGDGAFLAAALGAAPRLRGMLFDLPAVVDSAPARFERAGLAGRVAITAGDFSTDPLPAGADLVSLVRIVHDHDDARVLGLLRAVRAALSPGGTVLIAEPMAGTAGAEPVMDAYFGFYLLAMGRGRPRTPDELAALLRAAGFTGVRHLTTRAPIFTSVVVATA